MSRWGHRITDKLDAFIMVGAVVLLLGAFGLPLTLEQKQAASGLLLLLLGFIIRRWAASHRRYEERKTNGGSDAPLS